VESEVLSSKPTGCMWNLPIKKKTKKGIVIPRSLWWH